MNCNQLKQKTKIIAIVTIIFFSSVSTLFTQNQREQVFNKAQKIYDKVEVLSIDNFRKVPKKIRGKLFKNVNLNDEKQVKKIFKQSEEVFQFNETTDRFTNKRGSWQNDLPSNIYFTSDIKGNDLNDIITCGAYGFLAHFNGVGWKTYLVMIANSYSGIKIKENVVAVVGFSKNKAAIVVGRR